MGNDCTTTPPASYGRYPIATKPGSLASFMAAAQPLTSKFGYQEISGFVDDIAGSSPPYVYALSGPVQMARAQLNSGTAPLSFLKWNGKAFDSPGIGGADVGVLPTGAFQNCEAPAQAQWGSSVSYVDATQQYLLTFICVSPGDPALGPGNGGGEGGAWFYSTSYTLSDPTQWAQPKEITGTWSTFDQSGGCPAWNGYYPTFMSLGAKSAHLSTTRYVFSLWGCQGGGTTPPKRQMAARAFSMKVGPEISPGGVVPLDSTATTVQPGSWISIYGSNLATDTATWKGDFPVTLAGTSVTINGKPAYLSLVSPTQINLQAPDDTATGSVNVVVTNTWGSTTSNVTLGAVGPSFSLLDASHVAGIILRPDGSGTYGSGVNSYDIVGPKGTSLGYKTVPAKAGDSVVLFGVGFGPTNPTVPAGKTFAGAATTTNQVQLSINSKSVTPAFAGLTSAGLYQFNLTVPAGFGTGDVPLSAVVSAQKTPSYVVISLQ